MINIPKKGSKTGVFVKCEECGKIVYQTQTQYKRNKHHFCSRECNNKWRSNSVKEIRKCEFCGKEYSTNKGNPKRFCCIECQHEWQKTNTGFRNPKFEGDIVSCDWCGKQFVIGAYKLNNERHFCGNDCRRAWYANVFSQSNEWKKESSLRATKLLKENPITLSSPQIEVNKMLDDLDISYVNEKNYKYYAVDNYLSDYNLIIEVMGDYWHVNPNRFNNRTEINSVQSKRIPKDKAKHTFIKNYYGIEILYIWEYDINNRKELCELLIKKYVENNGVLQNYHSFNYHITDGRLELNEDIVYSYFDDIAV